MQMPGISRENWAKQKKKGKKIQTSPSSRIALQNSPPVCPLHPPNPRSSPSSFCPVQFFPPFFFSVRFSVKVPASSRRPWIATKTRRCSLAGRTSAGILKHPVFQGNRRIDPRVSSSARNVRTSHGAFHHKDHPLLRHPIAVSLPYFSFFLSSLFRRSFNFSDVAVNRMK